VIEQLRSTGRKIRLNGNSAGCGRTPQLAPQPPGIMHYPSFAECCDALSLKMGIVLADPLLGRGTLRMRGPAVPVAHSGNFALTFEVAVDGKRYAVRCFHKQADSLHERYAAIDAFLQSIGSPHFVACRFQPAGITTESGTYPIVRMEWAEGPTLAAFVLDHRNDVTALQALRASLRRLATHLQEHGIAHGDIQPANVIVQDATHLRLIDYDGMFVPQLAHLPSAELGQRNFQHPARRAWHFDGELDRFSFCVIDLALDALCRRSALWEQTESDSDAFIFRAADFADPANSPVFSLLAAVPGLEQRVHDLAAICMAPFEQIPVFEDFLEGRNVPAVPVRFSGDASVALRRKYTSVYEIVDARSFARCCARVGDRVELIGKVVRVAVSRALQPDVACLRVEFAERSHDMVCLKIWPDALARLVRPPDQTWVGQWLSTVGLVEPVHSAGSGAHRHKDVAISITDQAQLHLLSEAEAQRRLRGQRRPMGVETDKTAGVRTDAVVADPVPAQPGLRQGTVPPPVQTPHVPADGYARKVALPPPPVAAEPENAPSHARVSRPRARVPRWQWVPAALLAALAVYAVVASWASRTRAPATQVTAQPAPAATAMARPATTKIPGRLVSQQDLRKAPVPLETSLGALTIVPAADGGKGYIVVLKGVAIPGLRDDAVTLVHRAVFADRDVVVGFTRCDGADVPCGLRQPFWLELRTGAKPLLRRTPGVWASTGAGAVTAADTGVQVKLGVWNGDRRNATLTAAGDIVVSRTPAPGRPLSRADCAAVIQAAESCASSRDCSSFAGSARPIPAPRWAHLMRLYHETTGFDGIAFRGLCVRSCELGLTPSRGFIRSNVCNGARPEQWPPAGQAAGLMRR
jgi:hypothetical protein